MTNELLAPDHLTLEAASDAVASRLHVGNGAGSETDRTFFDTFDGLVRDAGLSVVHESGELALIETDSGLIRAALSMPPPTQPLLAGDLERGPLRDALAAVVDVRALLPLVHVHTRERPLVVLNSRDEAVVRLSVEEPALVSPPRHTTLRPRVRLIAVPGHEKSLRRVRRTLVDDLGFTAVDQPLVDEAVRAGGGVPGGTPSKVDVPLEYAQRADAASAAVLRALLGVIKANEDGTIADIDSEFLHDLRVSVRRSRAVQRECKRVFPPGQLERFRADFRWLQQATGEARDLDVYVLEFDAMRDMVPEAMRPDLDPLLEVLRARRAAAHGEMASTLRSRRATTLLKRWSTFLDRLESLPETDRPDAARPIGALAGERIRKVYRQMVKMGGAIEQDSPAESYHELRKKGKELRYLLELFGGPLYPEDVVKPMIRTLKALQDVLGRHQDREVQVATLSSLRDDVARAPGGPAALMAMGALVARLHEDELAARGQFAARFAEFASKAQRKLVHDTFG